MLLGQTEETVARLLVHSAQGDLAALGREGHTTACRLVRGPIDRADRAIQADLDRSRAGADDFNPRRLARGKSRRPRRGIGPPKTAASGISGAPAGSLRQSRWRYPTPPLACGFAR